MRNPEDRISTRIYGLERLLPSLRKHLSEAEDLWSTRAPEELLYGPDASDTLKLFVTDLARFQDFLGRLLWDLMRLVYQDDAITVIDALNLAAKMELIELTPESWKALREAGNVFYHEYPLEDTEILRNLELMLREAPGLLDAYGVVRDYIAEKFPHIIEDAKAKLAHVRRKMQAYEHPIRGPHL